MRRSGTRLATSPIPSHLDGLVGLVDLVGLESLEGLWNEIAGCLPQLESQIFSCWSTRSRAVYRSWNLEKYHCHLLV